MIALRERLPRDAVVTNGAGNYAIWVGPFHAVPRVRHAARADLRLDGLRRSGGGRGQAPAPGALRRRLRGRRLFPDERPGIRDRRPVRSGDHRDRGRQRHVRHHPHASGARPIPSASPAPRCATPISPPMPGPSAATARPSRRTADFLPAFERALALGLPAIIHVKVDPEALTPTRSLSAIRQEARRGEDRAALPSGGRTLQ